MTDEGTLEENLKYVQSVSETSLIRVKIEKNENRQ